LAAHPSVRTASDEGGARIGLLGVLNAALGEEGSGIIGAKGRMVTRSGQFIRIDAFVELRREGVDVVA
jgi:hypothetical protein